MDGLNEVKLIGNVGKDVELKHLDNDKKVAKIVVATNKTYKKQNGEKESKTEWHNIEFWGDTAQFCGNYVKKGMLLYICGELRTDTYDKDGVKQYRTKITGSEIKILSNGSSTPTPKEGATATADAKPQGNPANPAEQAKQYATGEANTVSSNAFAGAEDDLPF
jgi:single-strand DNA-binding protein